MLSGYGNFVIYHVSRAAVTSDEHVLCLWHMKVSVHLFKVTATQNA